MGNAKQPSTPASQSIAAAAATPSPGRWRHPKFDEITRRQSANTFDDKSVRLIVWNGGALLLLWLFSANLESYSWYELSTPKSTKLYMPYARLLLSCVFLYNIALALLPAMKSKDDMTDISLTPTQRALLGLSPTATPPPVTPGTQYVTPPRYSRSSTPRNSSPLSRVSADSPLSRRGSPPSALQASNSPFSPSPSPMWAKAIGSGRDSLRRHSYGSPALPGLGSSKDLIIQGVSGTPSPSTGRGSSVGLNSRWLYERGRASPGGRSLYP